MWLSLLLLTQAFALPLCEPVSDTAELEVYVLTSGPGNGVYTKVGHTALWVSGGGKRETVFNWGAYDSSQDNFLWHFFMGDAEYKLAMMSRPYNLKRVRDNEQRLEAQHLDLSPNMKLAIAAELAKLARPENHSYVYHWETQNCSSLIRDLIDEATKGALKALPNPEQPPTRRFEVLRHLSDLTWAWFGWHYMGSDYGDRPYTRWEWLHLPEALYKGLSEATVQWEGELNSRPLVDKTCILNEGEWAKPTPPNRTLVLWTIGALIATYTWFTDNRSQWFKIPIYSWLLCSGLLSSFFLYCWIFSSLEGYGFNENWFYSNPLQLFLAYSLYKQNTPRFLLYSILSLMAGGLLWELIDPTPQSNMEWIGFFGIPNALIGYLEIRKDPIQQ